MTEIHPQNIFKTTFFLFQILTRFSLDFHTLKIPVFAALYTTNLHAFALTSELYFAFNTSDN